MSSFAVEIVEIDDVKPHPNADRLDLISVKGWSCVAQKGRFVPGDLAVYIPIDSILPESLETKIFGADSKVRLNNHRVRTIKLRGAISQGMVLTPQDVGLDPHAVGSDVTKTLGITKYEPPVSLSPQSNAPQAGKKQTNPNFRKYTGIENAKNYPNVFEVGEQVVVTEKIHGTNFRAGWVKFHADTWWKKIKAFLGVAPKWDFVYGSHNVQLQNTVLYKGAYNEACNVYAEAVKKYRLKDLLAPGEVIYGEIYGDGIQKGYTYGCEKGVRKFVAFDIMRDDKWLDHRDFLVTCAQMNLPVVPILYAGPYSALLTKKLVDGDSVLAPTQKVREGVVVRPLSEETTYMGRKILKFISDEYLLRDNSEFH